MFNPNLYEKLNEVLEKKLENYAETLEIAQIQQNFLRDNYSLNLMGQKLDYDFI